MPAAAADRQAEELVDRVGHQVRPAERRDPEVRVRLGPDRVVDLGDDPLRPERLVGELGGHDVAVVALGHRDEDVGVLGAGPAERVLVGAVAAQGVAAERRRQPIEGPGRGIDDDHLVAGLVE